MKTTCSPFKIGLNIAFIHPDLGIGGAERLVVGAALELKARGHQVAVYTARHDPAHCLAETVIPLSRGGLDIRVHGDKGFCNRLGRLRAPLAVLRMTWLARMVSRQSPAPDLIFCDLVPHVLPLLRRLQIPLLYYCHYPDLLLTPARRGLYRLYRQPLDWLERMGTTRAGRILVNSLYTADIFQRTFAGWPAPSPEVLYPGVSLEHFAGFPKQTAPLLPELQPDDWVLLSLNRFDPRKNLPLALDALAALRKLLPADTFQRVYLVIAGGCDIRLAENRHIYNMLTFRAKELGVGRQVHLLPSPDDANRLNLLQGCHALIYTSRHEHFGIGVVEGLAAGRPVVAVREGGPCEIIQHGKSGFLESPRAEAFAQTLATLILNPDLARQIGHAGRLRAQAFSRKAFGTRLEQIILEMVRHTRMS